VSTARWRAAAGRCLGNAFVCEPAAGHQPARGAPGGGRWRAAAREPSAGTVTRRRQVPVVTTLTRPAEVRHPLHVHLSTTAVALLGLEASPLLPVRCKRPPSSSPHRAGRSARPLPTHAAGQDRDTGAARPPGDRSLL